MLSKNDKSVETIKDRKLYLIAGAATLLVSLCIILPIEMRDSNFISDLIYTYLTLGLALFLIMFGLMGNNFFKGLMVLFFSSIFSFTAWALFYPLGFLSTLIAFWLGIPSGIIAGLIFLLFNNKFLSDENHYKLILKQVISYVIILLLVSLMFFKGGDWMDEMISYFREKN